MEFELLKPEHYGRLKPFFSRQRHALSTYSLSSLIVWSQCIVDTLFAVEGDAVLFAEKRMDDPDRKHLLLPVSPDGLKSPRWLRDAAVAAGYREFHYVPQSYLGEVGSAAIEEFFIVHEQPEFEDYVYRGADLAGLPGRDYAKKRNLIRQFERAYSGQDRVEVKPITSANAGECMACLDGWRTERGQDWTDLLECERQAIAAALKNMDSLELQGLLVAIDGKVRGFGIGSWLKEDTWVLNFEKASDRFKGLYQFLDRECAQKLFSGTGFLNKECDLGDPGLAQAKQSYYPVARVKSFRLELR